MNKDDTLIERLVLQFEAFNRSEAKSPNTIIWYNSSLYGLLDFLKTKSSQPVLGQVDIEVVREYVLSLQNRTAYADHPYTPDQKHPLSATSIQGYVRAIKAFFNWLYHEGYTTEHRLERLRVPKAPKKLIEPLTEEEIALILSAIDSQTTWGSRNIALVILLLDSGLRISEARSLEMRDLHLDEGYFKVMGKGSKERVAPFGAAAQKALMKWIYHFRPESIREDKVFLNLDGQSMTNTGMQLVFRRLAKSSGVNRLHAHLLRHTFAVNYLMNGGDVFTLQQILGHTTLEMTRRYVNLASAHVMIQHKRFSPVDQMGLRQITRAIQGGRRRRVRRSG